MSWRPWDCHRHRGALAPARSSLCRALLPHPQLSPGSTICGHYAVARELGPGGMSTGYLAADDSTTVTSPSRFFPRKGSASRRVERHHRSGFLRTRVPGAVVWSAWVMPPAMNVGDLATFDVVLVSHNHYDHLNRQRVVESLQTTRVRCGLFLKDSASSYLKRRIREIVELDWWETTEVHGLCYSHCSEAFQRSRDPGPEQIGLVRLCDVDRRLEGTVCR